jgi:histidinol-phosphate phosphatase family protein
MTRAVFLDRDGVINQKPEEGEYITSWDEFHILPGVAEGIALLKQAGYAVIVITNQRCVAKGLLTVTDLEKMHEQMSQTLQRAGAKLDAIYYCPHDYEPPCNCRKPAPGLLLEAAEVHGVDLCSSWMVGDSEIDMQAGKRAGCKTVRVITDCETQNPVGHAPGVSSHVEMTASSLLDSSHQILEWDARLKLNLGKRKVIA